MNRPFQFPWHLALVSSLSLWSLSGAGCGPASTSAGTDTADDIEEPEPEYVGPRPRARDMAIGDLSVGNYLFAATELGGAGSTLRPVRLLAARRGGFTVSIANTPEPDHQVARGEGWPMLCLKRSLRYGAGDVQVELRAGAPVYALSAASGWVRVGLTLGGDFSDVVLRSELGTDNCTAEAPPPARLRVGATGEGDSACLFADHPVMDEREGLPVPEGAPLQVDSEEDEYAHVRVAYRGGELTGWLPMSVVAESSPARADWRTLALQPGRCAFPGRPELAPVNAMIDGPSQPEETSPSIPAAQIEQVFRDGAPRVERCRTERRDLAEDFAVELRVYVTIDSDGQVESVRPLSGAEADAQLTACVVRTVGRFRFPSPRSTIGVSRTYRFQPAIVAE